MFCFFCFGFFFFDVFVFLISLLRLSFGKKGGFVTWVFR